MENKMAVPLFVFGVAIYFSYLTEVAWWAWTGAAFALYDFCAYMGEKRLGTLLLIITIGLFILAITSMQWVYPMFN